MNVRRWARTFVLMGCALVSSSGAAGGAGRLEAADAAWARRAEGHDGRGHARAEPVAEAIAAYAAAIARDPDDIEAHWKLVRAHYFAGEFASQGDESERDAFDRAVVAAQAAFAALERSAGGEVPFAELAPSDLDGAFTGVPLRDVARVHFWSAIAWGGWTRHHGIFSVVREGVAGRMFRYAQVAVSLEPDYESGGAHRLLAALHTSVPRVPLITPWVDRARALPELDRALAIAPAYPGNRLLYALTLLDLAPERREEANALLRQVAELEPDPEEIVEQLAMREGARERLAGEDTLASERGPSWVTLLADQRKLSWRTGWPGRSARVVALLTPSV